MRVEWDPDKAQSNSEKHRVRFSDAEPVFSDPLGITLEDGTAENEDRYVTIGADLFGRILTVVYTWRGDSIRLISARKATNQEKREYERGI